jgi:hypothetical protein
MKVEFSPPTPPPPPDQPDAKPEPAAVVATAKWVDGSILVEADDPEMRGGVERAFRRTPVVTDDASYRRQGTHGEVQVQPGDLEWFRAVAYVRVPAELGLVARLVPGVTEGGFDPAAGYRRFDDSIERLESGT